MNSNPSAGGKAKYAWREIDRVEPPKRPAAERVSDFGQTSYAYDEATAQAQARRCIQCPHPTCVTVCPLHCPIPELLELTADGLFKEAAQLFFSTHNIPELASHTCVGGRVCEHDCILGEKSEPVPIRGITRFLLDYGWKHGLAEPVISPSKNRVVAVIGSGICGLVTADALSRMGYAVTVFDCRQKPGGRMMNGLPGFRVDTCMIARRVDLLQRRGVRFQMGVTFGQDVKLSDLRTRFDAVFLGFVRVDPAPLEVPGAQLRGVCPAFPFLATNSQAPDTLPDSSCTAKVPRATASSIQVAAKRVVVLGAGDTAMDVLRVAIRLGAADTLCLYRRDEASVPADAEEYADACQEGARFTFLCQPIAVIGNDEGHVTHVRCVRTEIIKADDAIRPTVTPVPGTEFDVPADVVFVAYGFTAPQLPASDEFSKLERDAKGRLVVDGNQMTNLPGVFAGGSIVHGPVPLVEVVQDARNASAAMDRYLAALVRETKAL